MFFSPSRKLFYDKNQYQPPKQLTAVLACGEDKKVGVAGVWMVSVMFLQVGTTPRTHSRILPSGRGFLLPLKKTLAVRLGGSVFLLKLNAIFPVTRRA